MWHKIIAGSYFGIFVIFPAIRKNKFSEIKISANTVSGRLVPSRYLSVFWDERRLGIRLRRARGLMGREEGK